MNCCRAGVAADGQSAEIWTGTQSTALAASSSPRRAEDHAGQDPRAPASAGRRLRPAHLAGRGGRRRRCSSNITKKPVKLILTREDDLTAARPRPMTYPRHEGRTRRQRQRRRAGAIGWWPRTSTPWQRRRASRRPAARTIIGWRGLDAAVLRRAEHHVANAVREDRGMRVHAWRGIGAGYNKFAAESFIDESRARAPARIRWRSAWN